MYIGFDLASLELLYTMWLSLYTIICYIGKVGMEKANKTLQFQPAHHHQYEFAQYKTYTRVRYIY
jgi:hypothetical protein